MKICFIGACGHTKQAYRYLKTRSDIELCGFAPYSPDERMTVSFAPEIPFFVDAEAMLDEIRPDLAVVSPVFGLTADAIALAARKGVGVFAEKPVASSLEELDRLEEVVKSSGIPFCAMHYLRFSPAFYLGAQMVRRGDIGDVRMVTAQKSYRYGNRPTWYGDRRLYGGTIPWVGIHAIDWIYHFTGLPFETVSALQIGKDPEMAALCQFTLQGGALAAVNIDFHRPKASPSHGDDRIRCVGTQGVLEIRDGTIEVINPSGVTHYTPKEAPELLEEFLNGNAPLTAEEIFYLTRVALTARDAADRGETLRINASEKKG